MTKKVQVVYEDDNIIVVNKPHGLITHPKNAIDRQPSLTDWVAVNYPSLVNIGEPFMASGTPISRHGIVHRLDRETSGLIIIAKNQNSFDYLKNSFKNHKIKKHYLALVYGIVKENAGTINSPLGRLGMKRTTQIEGKKIIDGKESITEYRVVRKFNKYSLLEIMPKTGRTHQIRVHLKSIGHPLVGDTVYAPGGWSKPNGLTRLFLHAYKLEFLSPEGGKLILECDLPEDLQNIINELE